MGIRGEIYSNRITVEGRTYFFNVKENRMGDVFLNIVESKPSENTSFERRSIVIFKENMQEFLAALDKALVQMKSANNGSLENRYRRDPARDRDRETNSSNQRQDIKTPFKKNFKKPSDVSYRKFYHKGESRENEHESAKDQKYSPKKFYVTDKKNTGVIPSGKSRERHVTLIYKNSSQIRGKKPKFDTNDKFNMQNKPKQVVVRKLNKPEMPMDDFIGE